MKRAGRFVTVTAIMIFCLSFFSSVSFLAVHAQHHCTSAHCSVCAVLVQCGQRLRSAAASGSAALFLLSCSMAAAFLTSAETREASCETLVSLKVEMLN